MLCGVVESCSWELLVDAKDFLQATCYVSDPEALH